MRKTYPVLLALLLGACAAPSDGPSPSSFYNTKDPVTGGNVRVVRLQEASLSEITSDAAPASAGDAGLSIFRSSGYSDARLGRGDVIDVTIFDTGEEGLFASANSKTLPLGRFTVDSSGNVNLPFVGRQRAIDSSPQALQDRIVAGLKGSAVNPQAVVTVVERPGSGVSIGGLVHQPGRVGLTARKERVLDGLALAGGASAAPGATMVSLTRGGRKASVSLARILEDQSQNVYLLPDDQLYLEDDAPSFTAMGAFKSTGEFTFEPGRMTLAQALARAGGLLDDRANASQVYVLRSQQVQVPSQVIDGKTVAAGPVKVRPTIYRADLKDIGNLALMQQFKMRDGDILYAGNSGMADFGKLFTIYQKSPSLPAAPLPKTPGL